MSDRLTTKEVADLLGVSKRTVIRNAKRYGWDRYSVTDSQGRPVTTYDKAQVLTNCSAKPGTETGETSHGDTTTPNDDTLTDSSDLSPMTITRDNAAALSLQEAIEAAMVGNRQNSRRIAATVALCASVVVLVAFGLFQVWLETSNAQARSIEIAEQARILAERENTAAVIAAQARYAQAAHEQVKVMRESLAQAAQEQAALREDLKALQGEADHHNGFSWGSFFGE